MDLPSLINERSFPSVNSSSCSLSEIWPLALNGSGVGGESGGVLGLSHFGPNLGGYAEAKEIRIGNRGVSVNESTVTEQGGSRGGGGRKRKDAPSEDESSKLVSTSNGNDMKDCDGKHLKISGTRVKNGYSKADVKTSSGIGDKPAEQIIQPSELPKQDYIHVRARRGQATDSHSLAERARREKISERMKILQDLVPGCNKVIGKAPVLDEIINYIQSLQHQVEFLSMKLETVDSRMKPSIEGFPTKEFSAHAFDTTGFEFGSQATRDYDQGSAPDWLHMQVGGGFDRTT